ncbi:MAG: hypothetical protein WC788_08065 [Candidatus Paceibacterota bacterium]|jgi:hypothetical protein
MATYTNKSKSSAPTYTNKSKNSSAFITPYKNGFAVIWEQAVHTWGNTNETWDELTAIAWTNKNKS